MNKTAPSIVNTALAFALLAVLATFMLDAAALGNGEIFPYAHIIGQLTISQYSILTIAMLLVWKLGPSSQRLADYKLILVAAVSFRILLIPVDGYTSNDVDRYLFDGFIAASGLDPYSVSHDADQLATVVAQWNPPPEHLKYVTLYPPLAISLYAFAASFGPDTAKLVWSSMIAFASILTLVFCVLSLKQINKIHHTALVALSPILLLEAGIGVHVDTFSALFIAISVYCCVTKKYTLVGIAIGLGTLVKLLPLVLMGPIFLYLRGWKNKTAVVLGFLTCVVGGYAMAFAIGWIPFGSTGVFFEKFRFGSPLFTLLEHYLASTQLFYAVLGLMLSAYAALAVFSVKAGQSQNNERLFVALQLSLSIPLLLGPIVYPWYLMSLVPVVIMAPRVWLLMWMALLPTSYQVLSQWLCCQQWAPATWPLVLTIVGVVGGVFFKPLKAYVINFFPSSTSLIKRTKVNL